VRILGADIPRSGAVRGGAPRTLVRLGEGGRVEDVRRPASLPELIAEIDRLAGDEPFLLGVDVPVVVPARNARTRPIENVLRRRLGVRLEPGGRAALAALADPVSGESLLVALAASGHACLGYPERDRRTSGLAEVHPTAVLKALLWQGSALAGTDPAPERADALVGYPLPAFRRRDVGARTTWRERAGALDLTLRALGNVPRFDVDPARDALAAAASEADLDRAVSVFDAALVAGTVLRYLETPESCVFVGQRESGYTILPADGFLRQHVLRDGAPEGTALFPTASLRERLAAVARVRPLDLIAVEGHPERLEASFDDPPMYEFDNVDEMLWWKHTRHLAGPALPVEGLQELRVRLGRDASDARPLRLVRSRHRTLSFRFDPPGTWRAHLPTRDGKVYPFRVVQATYETRPAPTPRRRHS